MRDLDQPGEFAGRNAIRFPANEEPEGFKPCALSQGGEGRDRFYRFHISRLKDIYDERKALKAKSADGVATSSLSDLTPRLRLG